MEQLNVFATENAALGSLSVVAQSVTAPGEYAITSAQYVDFETGKLYSLEPNGAVTFTVVDYVTPELAGTIPFTVKQALPTGEAGRQTTVASGSFRMTRIAGPLPPLE